MTRIAFLGLGAMGQRIVQHLIDANEDVVVWNRSPATAEAVKAPRAASAEDAARGADIIISMVTDDDASRAVWERGALKTASPQALAVEMSTISPARAAELAAEAGQKGLSFLDAPVAGSRPQAEAAALGILTGGSDDAVDRFRPVAEKMGNLLHAGPSGSGIALKMMVNGLLALQAAAMGELLAYAPAHGFSADQAADLLSNSPVTSPAGAFLAKQIAARQDDPMFTIDLLVKDLGYLLDGSDMPVMQAVQTAFKGAQAQGKGDRHITAVAL